MATFAEFFAGIGLVREAIGPLGWRCVFANDIPPRKAEMYGARFGLRHFAIRDIRCVRALPVEIDLITASFPCIDLSLAGNRAGLAGEHSGTIWPFLELLEARCRHGRRPAAVLLENVTGLLSSHGGRDLASVCRSLAAVGYVVDLVVVDARWFTPQSRPRLFILAWNRPERASASEGLFHARAAELGQEAEPRGSGIGALASVGNSDRWPLLTPLPGAVSRLRPRAVRRFQDAHTDIPFADMPLPEPPRQAPHALSFCLEDLESDDERWWSDDKTKAMLDGMAPPHRRRVDELLAGERNGVATMYRRRRNGRTVGEVRRDRIAGCLRTPQGGSSVQFLVDCRTGKPCVRPLTGREYARLQGAGAFPIQVGDRQAQLGFGDAVCVPAVRWLVQHAFRGIVAKAELSKPSRSLRGAQPALRRCRSAVAS